VPSFIVIAVISNRLFVSFVNQCKLKIVVERRGVVVTALVVSTKFLYVEPS